MIEITNIKKGGELTLGFKDKNGKSINYTYGMILTDEQVDSKVLEESMKTGTLSIYAKKNWVAFKRINVLGSIQGSPVAFKGISADEVDGTAKPRVNSAIQVPEKVEEVVAEVKKEIKVEEPKVEEIVAKTTEPKKAGRPSKQIKIEPQEVTLEDKPIVKEETIKDVDFL